MTFWRSAVTSAFPVGSMDAGTSTIASVAMDGGTAGDSAGPGDADVPEVDAPADDDGPTRTPRPSGEAPNSSTRPKTPNSPTMQAMDAIRRPVIGVALREASTPSTPCRAGGPTSGAARRALPKTRNA